METNKFLKFTEPRSQLSSGHIAQFLLAIATTTLFGCHSNYNKWQVELMVEPGSVPLIW